MSNLQASSIDTVPHTQRLITALSPFVDSGLVAGIVAAVASKDQLLGEAAMGFADLSAGRPMRVDSMFWVASQTKPITAAALMMLVDERKLQIDDPVENFLPEFGDIWVVQDQQEERLTLTRPDRPITVRDLLNHTSGLPFRSAVEKPTLDRLPLQTAVSSYAMTPLSSQPGTRYAYSNAGINTAGRIIEVVSGVTYETFLQERLFEPLGMNDTTFWPSEAQQDRLAKAYAPTEDGSALKEISVTQLSYPLDDPARKPMPAGGLFSTVRDMTTFCRMILGGGTYKSSAYLSEAAIRQMTSKQTPPEIENAYGLGWGIEPGAYGHGGAYATAMTIYPKLDRISIFLVQHDGFIGNGDQARAAFEELAKN